MRRRSRSEGGDQGKEERRREDRREEGEESHMACGSIATYYLPCESHATSYETTIKTGEGCDLHGIVKLQVSNIRF